MEQNNTSLDERASLRTIASQKLDDMLKEIGISEEEFRTMNRWEKVAEISENAKQREKPNKSPEQQSTEDESPSIDSNKKEIESIIGLKSRQEAIVKFKGSDEQDIIEMNTLKTRYPEELLKFYEDYYFRDKPDTK